MSKIKPCPLCGGQANVQKPLSMRGSPYNVYCGRKHGRWDEECGLVLFGGDSETRKEMIAKWNRRASN